MAAVPKYVIVQGICPYVELILMVADEIVVGSIGSLNRTIIRVSELTPVLRLEG